jgi:hypothetical protein
MYGLEKGEQGTYITTANASLCNLNHYIIGIFELWFATVLNGHIFNATENKRRILGRVS